MTKKNKLFFIFKKFFGLFLFKDITIPPYNYTIPAGQKVLLLNTPKGWYMRTTDNKLFAIRNPSSLMGDSTQSNFGKY